MEIITRRIAIERGLSTYYTGKPCKHGHLSERKTLEGSCIQCRKAREGEYAKTQYTKHREKLLDRVKTYSKKNKEKISAYQSGYRDENKDKLRLYLKDYYLKTKVERLEKEKELRKTEKYKRRISEYRKRKYSSDVSYKASSAIRTMLWRVLKKTQSKKLARTEEIIGYKSCDLISHIERIFVNGMSWSNYGKWHIDHIKPVSVFIKEGVTDPAVINALSNLQPLWAEDNFKKSDKYEE